MFSTETRQLTGDVKILPLVDIVFILLLFFMIAGSFRLVDPFVQIPVSSNGDQIDDAAMTIVYDKHSRLAVDGERISQEAMLRDIKRHLTNGRMVAVQLKVDATVPANELVVFTQELAKAGLTDIHLMTRHARP